MAPQVPGDESGHEGRRGRRGGRGRGRDEAAAIEPAFESPGPVREPAGERVARPAEVEPSPRAYEEDDIEEIGRPEGPLDERHVDPFGIGAADDTTPEPVVAGDPWREEDAAWEPFDTGNAEPEPLEPEPRSETESTPHAGVEEDAPGPGMTPAEAGPVPRPSFGRRRARRR